MSSLTTLYPVSDYELDILNRIYDYLISEKFEVEFNVSEDFEPKNFISFAHYQNFHISLSFKVSKSGKSFHLFVVNLQYVSPGGRSGDHKNVENQIIGVANLGVITPFFLRRENIKDKIADVFLREDVDFKEDCHFSSAFVLNTLDEAKARSFFTAERRQKILDLNSDYNICIESDGKILIVKDQKPINLPFVREVVQFLNHFV